MAVLAYISETMSTALPIISFHVLAPLILCLYISYLGVYAGYNLVLHPMRSIPGPFFAKFTWGWQNYHAFRLSKAHAIQGKLWEVLAINNPPIQVAMLISLI